MNLKVIREDSRYLWCECLKHDYLEKPPLCINKTEVNDKPKGYGYCFSCGYRIDIPPKEVDAMSKLKTISRKSRLIDWDKLNHDYQMQSFIHGKYNELRQQWKVNSLLKYGIGWCGDSHTFPMRREDGVIIGILRRFPDGKKICINSSQLGLFLPNMQITQVVVCEGLSDAAVATECGYWGAGLPSASFGHDIILKFLTIHKVNTLITIIADSDEIGKKSAKKLKNLLIRSGFYVIILIPEVGKDLREFYELKGKEYVRKWLKKCPKCRQKKQLNY